MPPSYFESAFESSPTASCLFSPSLDPTFLAVNDAFLQVVARTREELVGKRLFDIFQANPEDSADTGVGAMRRSMARVIETGGPDAMPFQRYPLKHISADGQEYFEEKYWSAVNTPVFDENGKLLFISHSTTDVTERFAVEAVLRQSEDRYRSLFNSINQGFCVIEVEFDLHDRPVDYRFCEVNPFNPQITSSTLQFGVT